MASLQAPRFIYIHGFNSSPNAHKAVQMGQWLARNKPQAEYLAPALSPYPAVAQAQLQSLFDRSQNNDYTYLIGSSLGGYFACYFAERLQCKAVLINPSVYPYHSLLQYLGENENYHTGEKYTLEESHAEELRAMEVSQLSHPEKVWVLLQTGDETLDFKEAATKYTCSPCAIEYGGDHSFQNFERWIPNIVNFFT